MTGIKEQMNRHQKELDIARLRRNMRPEMLRKVSALSAARELLVTMNKRLEDDTVENTHEDWEKRARFYRYVNALSESVDALKMEYKMLDELYTEFFNFNKERK